VASILNALLIACLIIVSNVQDSILRLSLFGSPGNSFKEMVVQCGVPTATLSKSDAESFLLNSMEHDLQPDRIVEYDILLGYVCFILIDERDRVIAQKWIKT
jgi:hypothetical protein